MDYSLSEMDRARFGYVTAKAGIGDASDVGPLIARARADGVALLVVRVPTDGLGAVHALEQSGARLMDTLMHYERIGPPHGGRTLISGYRMVTATAADAGRVGQMASRAFGGYDGHYHADPRLPRDQCDAVYASWAESSCRLSGNGVDVILIETDEGEASGFAVLGGGGEAGHDGILFGVDPDHRGRGIYAALLERAISWGADRGSRSMRYSTQVTNLAAQRALSRHGFTISHSLYTFHVWMD